MCIENRIQLIFIQNSHCLKIATKKQCISTRNEPFSGTLFGVANFETLPYDSPSILLVSSNFFTANFGDVHFLRQSWYSNSMAFMFSQGSTSTIPSLPWVFVFAGRPFSAKTQPTNVVYTTRFTLNRVPDFSRAFFGPRSSKVFCIKSIWPMVPLIKEINTWPLSRSWCRLVAEFHWHR